MMETLLAFPTLAITHFWRASWQIAIVVAIVFTIEKLFPTIAPNLRSWMWRAVFIKLLLLVALPFSFVIPLLPQRSLDLSQMRPQLVASPVVEGASFSKQPSRALPPTRATAASITLGHWDYLATGILACWLLGCSLHVAHQVRIERVVRCELRQSRSIVSVSIRKPLEKLAKQFGLQQLPPIRWTTRSESPRLIGAWQPTILLPVEWLSRCSDSQLQLAIAHELSHIARCDLVWNRLVAVLEILFFFHPSVRFACNRYLLAQEIACDALVIERTSKQPHEYAKLLLEFVSYPRTPAWDGSAAITGASVSLRERFVAMQQIHLQKRPQLALSIAVSLAVGLAVVPLSLGETPSKKPSSKAFVSPGEMRSDEAKNQSPKRNSATASSHGFAASGGTSGGNAIAGGASNGSVQGAARARASGSGSASRQNGNMATAEASAEVAIGANGDEQVAPPTSPNDSPSEVRDSSGSVQHSKSVSQVVSSTDDGDGSSWTRTTTASEGARQFKIEESEGMIKVTITAGDKVIEVTAKSKDDLQSKSSEAFAVYQEYVESAQTMGTSAPSANSSSGTRSATQGFSRTKSGSKSGGFARGSASGKAFGKASGKAFGMTEGAEGVGGQAQMPSRLELLRQMQQQLRDEAADNPAAQALIDQLDEEIRNEK
ncbi:peptidase M56 BlaR1 [Pirellula staleyi DSM 6068]|uniref:Peptidase M56 BlaR1 n=1 Tax=Pirellula staleyi (strain ATCC 27377 / DSM 6068 / ICPB 4128) TaxID=530564 RepID=D2QZY5_PIRSD|nr:M56 family metallopeptidase [Pirellula staleyi]ADB18350.1 peptidase M56 BlaR1 [Pirellula staleyi DSM 6068]